MDVTLRALESVQDYRACEELQRMTWGRDFQEVVPAAILKISQKVGGIAAGAFVADGAMAGFVFGITGWKGSKPCHWSHMLAVDSRFRDRGIGQRLKQHQRQELVANGVAIMYWTYDPLVARNAHMNLCRLGVTVDEYVPEMYGADDENALDQVIGTDRFIVRWDLESPTPRPPASPSEGPLINARIDDNGALGPATRPRFTDPSVRIGIPADIHELKSESPDLAAQWRANTRQAFLEYLGRGYEVSGFSTDPTTQAGFYHLRRAH